MLQKEGYPIAWLQELKDKNNLVELVSKYLPLQLKGGRYWGVCPFHHEKTPSFTVNEDGFYYCFGCHKTGDAITFVQEIEGLSFPEAVKYLADRAGMEVPGTAKIDAERSAMNKQKKERLYKILTETARFYHAQLMSDAGAAAREYLTKRGIGKNLMIRFGLGYSPNFNAAIDNLRARGFTDGEIVESGVGWQKADGTSKRPFDALQSRMIVPIFDIGGKVIAFSGRLLQKDVKSNKYMHFHNTAIFDKSKTVFAANFVKKEKQLVGIDKIILVEGYMDVFSLMKSGYNNAVAGMGTALTPGQAKIIGSLTTSVYVCYDGDEAGQTANLKNLEVLNDAGLNIHVITIPDAGMDPDDYIGKYGKKGFDKLIDGALPYIEYVLSKIELRYDLSTNTGRAKYVKDALDFIASKVDNDMGREVYLEIVSDKSRLSSNILREGFKAEIAPSAFETSSATRVAPANSGESKKESEAVTGAARFVLHAMLLDKPFAKATDILSAEVFENSVHNEVYQYIAGEEKEGRKPAAHMLFSIVQGDEVAEILNNVKEFPDEVREVKFYRDSLKVLNGKYLNARIKALSQRFDGAPNEEKPKIMAELFDMQSVLKNLK